MARRRKQSTAEDLMDLTAMAPWWVGVILAVVSYVGLHAYAQQPTPAPLQPGQLGSFAVAGMWRALAGAGQYFVPFIFLAGAAMSAFRRYRARQLHAAAVSRDDGVAQMSWHEFELLVGEYFRRQGFAAVNNFEAGPDGGVDVLLKKGADRYLVQCKHWRALRVGVQPVRELYGVMAAQRVAGGYVVTSGTFTDEARQFAEGRELKLIDGPALQRAIRAQAAAAPATPVRPADALPLAAATPAPAPRTAAPSSVPLCPICHAPMVQRQARNGANAGQRFWGCSRFAEAKCRGTRAMG
jgi:restriction system protein